MPNADPTRLAQFTPGEVSPDQGIPNFYYIDTNPDRFHLRYCYITPGFWDSVADTLRVGSYITSKGHGGASPYPLALTEATVRVSAIEDAPLGSLHKKRVSTTIGPNTLYLNQTEGFPPGIAYRSMISNANTQYRGIFEIDSTLGPPYYSDNLLGSEQKVDTDCYCWGSVVSRRPTLGPYNTPLIVGYIEPIAVNMVRVWWGGGTFGAPIAGTGVVFIYMEAYKPISNIT